MTWPMLPLLEPLMETVCATEAAAAKVAFPGWLAVTVHVPEATAVSVSPLTVQTVDGLAVKLTGSPEDAVALSVVLEPVEGAVTEAKVMVCGSPSMANVTVTGEAGL